MTEAVKQLVIAANATTTTTTTTTTTESGGVNPPWGTLAIEQYLIQKWDWNSPLSVEKQRDKLVLAFIGEEFIALEFDPSATGGLMTRTPTPEEISIILEPWRPQKLRGIAARHWGQKDLARWGHSYYVLRTYYDGGAEHDAKLAAWLSESSSSDGMDVDDTSMIEDGLGIEPVDTWWQVLDDSLLFDLDTYHDADDWKAVYKILPELAAPLNDRTFDFAAAQEALIAKKPLKALVDSDFEEAVLEEAARKGNWLLILDKYAFENDEVRLLFRDAHGNVVKEIGAAVSTLGYLRMDYGRLRKSDLPWWTEAVEGDLYHVKDKRGRIMRANLAVMKAAFAPVPRRLEPQFDSWAGL
ncbi:hypothetical protein QBC35DRAFT_393641 [Podospora australis]|uniref:Uncharacterized protein n=1 Tax=Podospora australis TaxID=1536484 RepID=A0AAN7AF39_9PEZI|nr:hypothetical protein QBC35DRAFT_393641 [Podospora australis]